MHYQISRNGQMYGPYTLEDLQRYVASGNVLGTDLAKSEAMSSWVPVSQILAGTATPPPATPAYSTPGFGPSGYAEVPTQPVIALSTYPDAPNLHWGLVLLFTVISCGLFSIVWELVVNAWLKRVQPNSKSLMYYILTLVAMVVYVGAGVVSAASHKTGGVNPVAVVAWLATSILSIVARFTERASLEEHFNTVEPVGLQLSGVMTFFFSLYYFQYHLNRINEMKKAARYASGSVRP